MSEQPPAGYQISWRRSAGISDLKELEDNLLWLVNLREVQSLDGHSLEPGIPSAVSLSRLLRCSFSIIVTPIMKIVRLKKKAAFAFAKAASICHKLKAT